MLTFENIASALYFFNQFIRILTRKNKLFLWAMENKIVENTVIFQNPDGSIQLGLQPHKKSKKQLACWNCKKMIVSLLDV